MTQDANPYLPPKSHVPIPEENRAIIPAGKGRRLGTLLIDYAVFLGITFLYRVLRGSRIRAGRSEGDSRSSGCPFRKHDYDRILLLLRGLLGENPRKTFVRDSRRQRIGRKAIFCANYRTHAVQIYSI